MPSRCAFPSSPVAKTGHGQTWWSALGGPHLALESLVIAAKCRKFLESNNDMIAEGQRHFTVVSTKSS
jgi:hypothetical protein